MTSGRRAVALLQGLRPVLGLGDPVARELQEQHVNGPVVLDVVDDEDERPASRLPSSPGALPAGAFLLVMRAASARGMIRVNVEP